MPLFCLYFIFISAVTKRSTFLFLFVLNESLLFFGNFIDISQGCILGNFSLGIGKICLYFQLGRALIPDPNKEGKILLILFTNKHSKTSTFNKISKGYQQFSALDMLVIGRTTCQLIGTHNAHSKMYFFYQFHR